MALSAGQRVDLADLFAELGAVIAAPDRAAAVEGIERLVALTLGASSVHVTLIEEAARGGAPASASSSGSGPGAGAGDEAADEAADDAADDVQAHAVLADGTRLRQPLLARDGRHLGWVTADAAPPGRFDTADDRLLASVLGAAGAALERHQLVADLEEAQRQRQAFFGVVSHELRTPITTIYGGTRVLRQSGARLSHDARQQLLDDVGQEAERLYRLVEDLLVLSRAEREALVVAAEPILIQHLVSRVVASEQQRWPRTNLRATPDRGLPPVLGDSTLVEQVLRNLISNAAKYAGEAGPIEISAVETEGWVEVRVLDEGPGVETADLERVFDLFYRAADAPSRAQGAGIGLYACRELIEAMGGRIWVTRRPTGGAAFGFRLQAQSGDDELASDGLDGPY